MKILDVYKADGAENVLIVLEERKEKEKQNLENPTVCCVVYVIRETLIRVNDIG